MLPSWLAVTKPHGHTLSLVCITGSSCYWTAVPNISVLAALHSLHLQSHLLAHCFLMFLKPFRCSWLVSFKWNFSINYDNKSSGYNPTLSALMSSLALLDWNTVWEGRIRVLQTGSVFVGERRSENASFERKQQEVTDTTWMKRSQTKQYMVSKSWKMSATKSHQEPLRVYCPTDSPNLVCLDLFRLWPPKE